MSQLKPLNAFSPLLERHIDDVAFLWVLRSVAVGQPHYGLFELKKLERRIDAHIDALLLSPEDSWDACEQAAEFEEGGESFVMAVLAFRQMDVNKIQRATEFALANSQTKRGMASALAWLDDSYSLPWIRKFLKSKDLGHKYLALAALSVKREDPGEDLKNIFTREDCLEDIELYARALRLVGELKRVDLIPALNKAMDHKNEDVKFWGAWSALLLGNRSAVQYLKPTVMNAGPNQGRAIDTVFRALPIPQAREWVSELSSQKDSTRVTIRASAVLGDPQVVPWLIDKMKNPEFSRLAGEAFVAITGIDLERYQLENELPNLFEDLEDNQEIVDEYGLDDENLAWPNTEKVAAVWQKYGSSFTVGKRYFWGKAAEVNLLNSLLVRGGQRQRHAAALELTLSSPEAPYPNANAKVSGEVLGG